jgi:threonine dehydratase
MHHWLSKELCIIMTFDECCKNMVAWAPRNMGDLTADHCTAPGQVIEPSAGVGVAVLQRKGAALRALGVEPGTKVAVILCGGNIDLRKPLPWAAN